MALLEGGREAGLAGRLEEDVPNGVVTRDKLPMGSATQTVVSQGVCRPATCKTGALMREDRKPKPVSDCRDVLCVL